jgi:geranylgeranyl diphosphate synthase type II
MKNISQLQEIISEGVSSLSFGNRPENLYEPITYILSLGGKRLRPALVLLSYQLSGKDPAEIVRPALSVEVFHNFTLMHDDIMDEAPIRRGQPTVHEKWNQTVAILSGDTMLVKAYDLLLESKTDDLAALIRRFNTTATEVCEGQQIDMNYEERDTVTEAEYIEMIRLKTAVLLGFSMEFGGELAGMRKEQTSLLYQVGESMGIGFQLMDDYLDVYADASKFGKQVGGDIISNKKTYLLINALSRADQKQRAALDKWLAATDFDNQEKVKAVMDIYDEIGIPELTRDKMNAYFDKAFGMMEQIEGDQQGKAELEEFAKKLMKRDR